MVQLRPRQPSLKDRLGGHPSSVPGHSPVCTQMPAPRTGATLGGGSWHMAGTQHCLHTDFATSLNSLLGSTLLVFFRKMY